jgi:hypothetical protein
MAIASHLASHRYDARAHRHLAVFGRGQRGTAALMMMSENR